MSLTQAAEKTAQPCRNISWSGFLSIASSYMGRTALKPSIFFEISV